MVVGGALGLVDLGLDGVLRDGAPRQVFGATMVLLLVAAVPLAVRGRAGRRQVSALVLLGDLIYAVVALSVEDPVRHAPPLMLLFSSFVAAWFLGPVMLAVNMAATVAACAIGLAPSFDDPADLVVQVVVGAGVLNTASAGVFVLRRRVQRLLAATQALSSTDPLTGLANRRFLVEQAPRIWRQARRDGSRVAAMLLDLDHFKRLNDLHGHAAGDAVLRSVADALASCVRPSDVLARTGGEELVVLGMVSDPAEASHLAERLRAAVAVTTAPDGVPVTASIGIALTRPLDGEEPAAALWRLVDRADVAMYQAKQEGRDRVRHARVPAPRAAAETSDPGVAGSAPTA
jgi:diguanylate cyclase (GGDEF)-like protein